MNIDTVIRETLVALFLDDLVASQFFLKGGTALRFSEQIDVRLSTDIDFSTPSRIQYPDETFVRITESLRSHFAQLGYELFDASHQKKPKTRKDNQPSFWSGWKYEFKLIPTGHNHRTIEKKRKNALVPAGNASSKILIEISESEYCEAGVVFDLDGVKIRSYPASLLLLEKLRAICQQHPEYQLAGTSGRARDYYDIHAIYTKHRNEAQFLDELANDLPKVFQAKEVRLFLLNSIFERDFIEFQKQNFRQLSDTVKGTLHSFDFYNMRLKQLVSQLKTRLRNQGHEIE